MSYVNCARYPQEQNLMTVQVDGEICYDACKDIPQGTELLVWYGDSYVQFMGIPVAVKELPGNSTQAEADCKFIFSYSKTHIQAEQFNASVSSI